MTSFIRNLSLTIKVAVTASLVFVVFAATISYISFHHFQQEFETTIHAQQNTLVSALSKNIDDKLRIALNGLTASATRLDGDSFADPDKAQAFLDSELALHSIFDTGLFIIDKNGKLVAESPFRPNRRGRDLSGREYFVHSQALQKPYISKPYAATRNHGNPALRMSTPIYDRKGQWLGILAGRMDLLGSNILSQIGKTQNGMSGYVFMVDQDGIMILHHDRSRLLKTALGANPLIDRAILHGFNGTEEVVNSYGNRVIMTITHLQTTGWILASNYPKEEADAPFQRALHFISAMLAAGLILLIIILAALMQRLTKPLTQFTEHVETLPQKPDRERVFNTPVGGEIGILVHNFNKMILTLAEQRKELQLHQEQLEILVQERTTDLHEAQQIGHIGNWKLMLDVGSIYWSDEIYRILGYRPNQFNASYQRLLDARHPDDAMRIEQSEQLALENGNQHSIDYRIVLPDQSIRWVHEEVRAERNEQGQLLSLSGTLQDISERKQVEQALIESREAAESASRAKSLFLSSMSHELRTPLNAVLGFAQLLSLDESASEEIRSNANEIELAGRHLLDLVSDILDLARIESGRIDLSIEDIDPMLVLNECHSLLDTASRNRHLSWQSPAHLPHLRADRIRLRQILLNLLSNAIKYNRDGGRIEIRGQTGSKRGCYRISISDTGQGIPAERMHELFQPFNRIGAERGQIEGTGIGLVITRTLVHAMQGDIGVESSFGKGSTFWFELPVTQVMARQRDPAPPNCILAAEDHEPNRKLLRQQIEKLGYRVEFAFDGNEALEMWQSNHYQLLLTDCNMPVMDGYELAQAIRTRESVSGGHIPIVALTANTAKDAAKACIAAGMDDFLVKPVHLHQLQNTLAKWLQTPPATTVSLPSPPDTHPLPAYDDYLQNLAELLGDDDIEEARRMLHGFLASARECLFEARAALPEHDSIAFIRATHKLKSSARMIGATALADLCQRAEQAGMRKDWELMALELPSLEAALLETEERISALPNLGKPSAQTRKKLGEREVSTEQNQELAELRVMLIDDDPFILNYLTRLLTSHGVTQVRFAGEGEAALTELKHQDNAIDVMVCDLNMPGMDGVEFLRHLADAGYTGALIIISGNADLLPTIYELAQAHGLRILGTLAKPFTPQRFFDILHLQLGERRSARPRSSVPTLRPTDVAEGMGRGEFVAWFQPKVDAHTLKPYGAEALARWQRPDGSVVTPFAFVPLMEVHGLIDQLFVVMLRQTLASARILHNHGFGDVRLAVNLAASTLGTLNLPDIIDQELQKHQVAPDRLILEITESGLMHDARIGLDVLLRLRLKGIGLSIDDFGTGYSTIDQLRRLPFTELKVDQSFVASAAKNPASQIILQSSIEMARRLNLRTVAEGVENEQDLHMIRELGCDVVQGFLVAKPMPLNEFIVWLQEHGNES